MDSLVIFFFITLEKQIYTDCITKSGITKNSKCVMLKKKALNQNKEGHWTAKDMQANHSDTSSPQNMQHHDLNT